MKARILVVDDEERMAAAIARALRRAGHACATFGSGEAALEALERDGADAIVTDRKMPGVDGLELLRRVRASHPELPVILVTAHADVPSAVAAMRDGAFDYVAKPFDNEELRAIVARALELRRLDRENRWLRQEVATKYDLDDVVAESPKSREALDLVRRVAPTRSPVLIQGDSGTGKELIARLLHFHSDRVGRPFVAVNCKAFAPGVLESELFGHEKGAFTGASATRVGCFERASGGTLFLDEIGEVTTDFQAKLLRVLQENEVQRVGGTEPRAIDVRIVAATNRDLPAEIEAGRFREDLFFRLNVIPVLLAPLRERRDDILPIAERLLARACHDAGRAVVLSDDAREALAAHDWPGNVRELENAIERAVVLARGEAIEPEDLLIAAGASRRTGGEADGVDASRGTLQECLDRATAERIRAALEASGGAKAAAAVELGVDRTTLYRLMKRLGVNES